MSQVTQLWKKISLKLFFPEEKRLLFWSLLGPLLLLFSSIVLVLPSAPLQSLLLTVGVFLLIAFYFAPEKITQFALGAVALFAIFCLKGQERGISFFDVIWTVQYLTSLFVAQRMIFSTREYVCHNVESLHSIESDKLLWESRFDTLREKIDSDREVWESEIEAAKEEADESVAYAESLRRLVETAHTTIRELEQEPKVESVTYDQHALLQNQRESFVSSIDSMRLIKEKDEIITRLENQMDQKSCENYETAALESKLQAQESEISSKDQQIEDLEQMLKEQEESEKLFVDGKEIDSDGVIRILNELNEAREQNYQLEILLSDAKEKLEELQSAVESRRERNQDLLKTSAQNPITLQGLAKRAKR